MNSYSNKLEDILDGREYLTNKGSLDRALHDASVSKDKALKALKGLDTICQHCTDNNKRQILINATIHFKEVVNTYLFAIKLYLEEEYPNVDEEVLLKRYDLYEID